jgi:hypothetical protein
VKKVFFAQRQVFSLFLLMAGLSVFSCQSTSESTLAPEQPLVENPLQEEEVPEGEVLEAEATEEEPDEGPITALLPEAPEEEDGEIPEPEEPSFDFVEVVVEPTPPPEQPLDSVLPEPVAPEIAAALPPPEPPPPETPPPSPEPAAPPPVAAAPPPAPIQEVPPVVRPVPQNPPSFIRPAEEERPPVVREPVPLPAAPIPEAPARSPPVVIQEPGISFSRVVRATVGQMIEVPFQGSGWVYLGELGSRPGIAYSSRRLDPEGQSFVFRAEAPGTYGLKFYKQDFVRDYILNDYVQVIVGEPPEAAAMGWFNPSIDRGRVVAEPRWPTALAEAEAFSRGTSIPGAVPGAAVAAVPGTTAPTATGAPAAGQGGPAPGTSGGAADTAPAASAAGGQPVAPPAAGQTPVPPATGQAAQPSAAVPPPAAVPSPARPALSDEGVIPVRPAASVQPSPGAEAVQPEALGNLQPGGYLERARQEFDAGRVATAISVLDQLRERYPSGTDEAWWLYGQFYEANSPSRDIRTSLDYYRRLVREYPQSSRYNDARRRIAYLERYYINIQ